MNKIAHSVDFGHAQEEEGALSCIRTEGYTAPQILFANAPNSRHTDGYSVGKTLQKLISNLEGYPSFSEKNHQVRRIAEELCAMGKRCKMPGPDGFGRNVGILSSLLNEKC
jgi:hypothetical protein